MPGQAGLVVHPRRDIEGALDAIRAWASKHEVSLGQVRISGQERTIGEPVGVASCDFVIAVGGDGTALAALHAAAPAGRSRPGVACGSIGVLTSVDPHRLDRALEQVAAGDWVADPLQGLEVRAGRAEPAVAIQRRRGRTRRDRPGHHRDQDRRRAVRGDGRRRAGRRELGTAPLEATIGLRPDYATMITLAGQETMLAGLRRRGLVVDSPRILAHHPGAARRLGQVAPACRQTSSRNTISVESDFLGPNLRMRV